MLVNLSNIFTRDETEKQLSAEFDFSAENVSYDATFEKIDCRSDGAGADLHGSPLPGICKRE